LIDWMTGEAPPMTKPPEPTIETVWRVIPSPEMASADIG